MADPHLTDTDFAILLPRTHSPPVFPVDRLICHQLSSTIFVVGRRALPCNVQCFRYLPTSILTGVTLPFARRLRYRVAQSASYVPSRNLTAAFFAWKKENRFSAEPSSGTTIIYNTNEAPLDQIPIRVGYRGATVSSQTVSPYSWGWHRLHYGRA